MFLVFQIDRGNLIMMFTNVISLKRKSMWWKTLILFLQMSNPHVKKLYCICLRTLKQWSRWSLKEGVSQWDMFPELAELLLIGCSIELIWIPRSKSNTSTPKTNSQTSQPKGISHVMNGIICCACSILAITVQKCALKQQRNDLNTIQEKSESQQNLDQWRALLQKCRRTSHPRLQWARWREVMEIRIPGVQLLRKRRDRSDLMKAQTAWKLLITVTMSNLWKVSPQQATQSRMMTMHGLLKSGKLIQRCTSDRGDPMKLRGKRHEKLNLFLSRGNSSWRNRAIRHERSNISWQSVSTRYRFSRRDTASTLRHWKRWSRIGIVSRIKIIRESGELSGVTKTETIFDECYWKWTKTFHDLVNVYGCYNGNRSIHGKELPGECLWM